MKLENTSLGKLDQQQIIWKIGQEMGGQMQKMIIARQKEVQREWEIQVKRYRGRGEGTGTWLRSKRSRLLFTSTRLYLNFTPNCLHYLQYTIYALRRMLNVRITYRLMFIIFLVFNFVKYRYILGLHN